MFYGKTIYMVYGKNNLSVNTGGLVTSGKNICKVTLKATFKRLYLEIKCLLWY